MYLANKFVAFAVLLYIWKHGDCATYVEPDADEMKEISAIFSPGDFKKLTNWIRESKACLRNGEEAENACYALDDVFKGKRSTKDVMGLARVDGWLKNPRNEDKTKLWYRRLYNALGFSLSLSKEDKTKFLLAQYGTFGNQRYEYDDGLGDKQSFSKAQINSGIKYGSSIEVDVAESKKDISKTAKEIMKWMKTIME